jgi:cytochrome P450
MEYNPLASVRRLGKAQRCMLRHLKAMMKRRQNTLVTGGNGKQPTPKDVLGALVVSQVHDDKSSESLSQPRLTEEEIIGNIFIFVV